MRKEEHLPLSFASCSLFVFVPRHVAGVVVAIALFLVLVAILKSNEELFSREAAEGTFQSQVSQRTCQKQQQQAKGEPSEL